MVAALQSCWGNPRIGMNTAVANVKTLGFEVWGRSGAKRSDLGDADVKWGFTICTFCLCRCQEENMMRVSYIQLHCGDHHQLHAPLSDMKMMWVLSIRPRSSKLVTA